MLDCLRFGSQPMELSSSPICYSVLLYNGAGTLDSLHEALPLTIGDYCLRDGLFYSEICLGSSLMSSILWRNTDMMSNYSRSRWIRFRFRLSLTIFSCFLIVFDLREIFYKRTCIMLIWHRARECIFFLSFLALPGTFGAFRFWTSFSVDMLDWLSYLRRCKHLRTSLG